MRYISLIIFHSGIDNKKQRTANKVLPKAGLKCFYETFVQDSIAVILMNFCVENPRFRQYPNRCSQSSKDNENDKRL